MPKLLPYDAFAGLDAYNAFNVVESLVSLARNFNRTVVFTIHQPRSNIVSLFDQLVLLAQGRLVYAGEFNRCQTYFDIIGHHCPPGFNIADYLSALLASMHRPHPLTISCSRPHGLRREGVQRLWRLLNPRSLSEWRSDSVCLFT